jgi:hypothetical protein
LSIIFTPFDKVLASGVGSGSGCFFLRFSLILNFIFGSFGVIFAPFHEVLASAVGSGLGCFFLGFCLILNFIFGSFGGFIFFIFVFVFKEKVLKFSLDAVLVCCSLVLIFAIFSLIGSF